MNEYLDKSGLQTFTEKLTEKYDTRYAKPDDFGSPLVASTAADMTDHDKVYVYVGSETGYTSGDWYYWDGTAWADGGVYNSTALETDTTLTEAGKAADAKAVGDALAEKANIDGYYADMTVGNSEQLISNTYESDKVPYNFRTAGGSIEIGNREDETIVGGTLAFNQLASLTASDWNKSGVSNMSVSGTEITMEVSSSTSGLKYYQLKQKLKANHVYFFSGKGKTTDSNYSFRIGTFTSSNSWQKGLTTYSATYEEGAYIYKAAADAETFTIRTANATPANTVCVAKDVMLIDLTLMFGATIANYINTLETATEGAGVAWFKRFFPKEYYTYNAGELMSVKTSAHKTVGFNAYNNTAGTAKLLGGYEYQITGTYTAISYTDINGNAETITPDADGKFTPTNDGTMTVMGGNGTDTCIHLVWDGERDDEWEAYKENSYALDSDLELRGLWKLDSSNKPYCDGDIYESDGTVTRKYEYRAYASGDESLADAITDGTHTVVKLTTPTTESADAYTNPQIVDDWGTEEYVDSRTVPIPVGHDTKYLANLKAKLEMAPNSPDGDGDYIVRQTDGENLYVPFVIPKELPTKPSEDGTYDLVLTVADGTPTLAWVART